MLSNYLSFGLITASLLFSTYFMPEDLILKFLPLELDRILETVLEPSEHEMTKTSYLSEQIDSKFRESSESSLLNSQEIVNHRIIGEGSELVDDDLLQNDENIDEENEKVQETSSLKNEKPSEKDLPPPTSYSIYLIRAISLAIMTSFFIVLFKKFTKKKQVDALLDGENISLGEEEEDNLLQTPQGTTNEEKDSIVNSKEEEDIDISEDMEHTKEGIFVPKIEEDDNKSEEKYDKSEEKQEEKGDEKEKKEENVQPQKKEGQLQHEESVLLPFDEKDFSSPSIPKGVPSNSLDQSFVDIPH